MPRAKTIGIMLTDSDSRMVATGDMPLAPGAEPPAVVIYDDAVYAMVGHSSARPLIYAARGAWLAPSGWPPAEPTESKELDRPTGGS